MSKKKINSGIVYSTNPDYSFGEEERGGEVTLPPKEQNLKVFLETKHRAGKSMTVVSGFRGTDVDLQELGKKLKILCGTGGSTKDGNILIQGDHRPKIADWLMKNGYSSVKKM